MSNLITTVEVAKTVGIAPDSVRLMRRSGRLRAALCTRTGYLFEHTVVEEIARRREVARQRSAHLMGDKRREKS